MRIRLVLSVLLSVGFIAAAERLSASGRAQDAGIDVAQILDRYAHGDSSIPFSLPDLINKTADGRLLASLQGGALAWTDAAGPPQVDRRRLAVATFVLEAVYAQEKQTGKISVSLIEFSRDLLRGAKKPLPAERDWLAATLALMESAATPTELASQLAYARARFKNDPRVLMADAWVQKSGIPRGFRHNPMVSGNPYFPGGPVIPTGPVATPPKMEAYPQRTAPEWFAIGMDPYLPGFTGQILIDSPHPGSPSVPALTIFSGSSGPWPPVTPVEAETRLWKARDDYEHARGTKALAAEVELRLGTLDLAYAKPKDAIDHFTQALKRTTDCDLEYIAQFLIGRANEKLEQWSDAERAYRAALDAAPNGRSAANALATLLDSHGKASDAAAVRARVIDPSAVDPIEVFKKGDLVPVAAMIATLRSSIR